MLCFHEVNASYYFWGMPKKENTLLTSFLNKRATYSYTLLDTYTAGIKLLGSEIKSIRQGRLQLTDAYAYFDKNRELWVQGIHISAYPGATWGGHDPGRKKKLLLHKRELGRLYKAQAQQGNAIVVQSLFINAKGLAKVRIALGKGKKNYDKRAAIKAREQERHIRKDFM